jgi:hypothetical protein
MKKLRNKKMAEFSKQYQEAFDFDWNDFDYEEIYNNLEKNQLYSLICEGLGTLAVARGENDQMLLAIQSDEDPEMVIWKTLPEVVQLVKDEWNEKNK